MDVHITASRAPTVSMHVVRLLSQLLEARGMMPGAFLRYVGLSEAELAMDMARVDMGRYRQISKLLGDMCSVDDFVDRTALSWHGWLAQAWPEMPSLWVNSPTLESALLRYVRYRPLINEANEVRCHINDKQLIVSYLPDQQASTCPISLTSHFIMVSDLVRHYRERLDTHISMRIEVGQLHQPGRIARLSDVLQAPIIMTPHLRTHRVILEGRALRAPVSGYNELSSKWAAKALDAHLVSLEQTNVKDLLTQRIEALVSAYWNNFTDANASLAPPALLAAVSQSLGVSRWTLRRQLADRGYSFSELVENLRAQRLAILLSTPERSLLEIGTSLGFSSQSAFSKYFRERYGHPPSQDLRRATGK